MTTDKPDNNCFNMTVLRDIVDSSSTTDRHYDCPTTEIVPERGGGVGNGSCNDGHGSGGGKRAQQPVDAQNEALDKRYHPARVADDFNSADDEQIAADIDAVLASPDLATRLEEAERLRQVERLADAIYCPHANEVPGKCPCGKACYCKGHTCKPSDDAQRRAHHDAYPEARGGVGELLSRALPDLDRNKFDDFIKAYREQEGKAGAVTGRFEKPDDWLAVELPQPTTINICYDGKLVKAVVVDEDANATLNLLRDLEQRVQAVHRCGDAEQARLLLVAIKGILNGAIHEREQR